MFIRLIKIPLKFFYRLLVLLKNKNQSETSVLYNLKKRPQAPIDFLSRYEKILKRNCNWQTLEFKNKIVLELGCGPHLGFGPLAIFLGAKEFLASDPKSSPEIFDSENLKNFYFLSLYKDLIAIYGNNTSFDDFYLNLKKRTTFINKTCQLEENFSNKVDIQLSNSCLEHISDFEITMKKLNTCLNDKGRFLHSVDFGNHKRTKNPFDDIYNNSMKECTKKFGDKINLITPSKMLDVFRKSSYLNPQLIPYYYSSEGFEKKIHKDWERQLDKNDYFLKVGIIAGPINH